MEKIFFINIEPDEPAEELHKKATQLAKKLFSIFSGQRMRDAERKGGRN